MSKSFLIVDDSPIVRKVMRDFFETLTDWKIEGETGGRCRSEAPMKTNQAIPHFKTMAMVDVPRSRSGKHKKIVTAILSDLDDLGAGAALKVPLAKLGDSKERVRSAFNRATHKSGREVATATDENFLYVWNVAKQ